MCSSERTEVNAALATYRQDRTADFGQGTLDGAKIRYKLVERPHPVAHLARCLGDWHFDQRGPTDEASSRTRTGRKGTCIGGARSLPLRHGQHRVGDASHQPVSSSSTHERTHDHAPGETRAWNPPRHHRRTLGRRSSLECLRCPTRAPPVSMRHPITSISLLSHEEAHPRIPTIRRIMRTIRLT